MRHGQSRNDHLTMGSMYVEIKSFTENMAGD